MTCPKKIVYPSTTTHIQSSVKSTEVPNSEKLTSRDLPFPQQNSARFKQIISSNHHYIITIFIVSSYPLFSHLKNGKEFELLAIFIAHTFSYRIDQSYIYRYLYKKNVNFVSN